MACPTWKEVAGYYRTGLAMYRVSDDGQVQSRHDKRCVGGVGQHWRPLRAVVCKRRGGHLKVTLCGYTDGTPFDYRQEQRYVHDLVLEAFVGPKPVGMEACHDPDRNPANNSIGNLRWGTRTDNVQDMMRHGTHFTPFAKPPILPPDRIAEMQRRADAGETTRALAVEFGVSKSTSAAIVGRKGHYKEKSKSS